MHVRQANLPYHIASDYFLTFAESVITHGAKPIILVGHAMHGIMGVDGFRTPWDFWTNLGIFGMLY